MSKATQGRPYTIVKGDNLSKIAKTAYGDPRKWRVLWKANQTVLRSSDPDLIYPGEVITIPMDPDLAKVDSELDRPKSDEYLPGKDPEAVTFLLNGKELPVMSARILRTMDTVTDGFAVEFAWDPSDVKLRNLIKPYGYDPVKIYLGGYLILTGRVYIVKPTLSDGGSSMVLEGFSPTADIMDSTIRPPLEAKKITLQQRAESLLEAVGLTAIFDADSGDQFDRVTATESETIFDHLASLAVQRKVLISSTIRGELIFYQAQIGQPVGTIEEGKQPYETISAEFDGRKRFNTYRVVGPTPKKRTGRNSLEAIAKDDSVPRSRFLTERVDDATPGNIQAAADWRRSRQASEALTIEFPVSSWYAPNGQLWRENTIVTIKSQTIFVPDGFDFLIKSVEYTLDGNGSRANLSLVPPQVFTGEPIEEPWR